MVTCGFFSLPKFLSGTVLLPRTMGMWKPCNLPEKILGLEPMENEELED